MNEFNIPRTDDAGGNGHDAKRVDNPDPGIVAPDSDGLVCEQCDTRLNEGEKRRVIIVQVTNEHGFFVPLCGVRVCFHCYEIAVDRIKNILAKYIPKTEDVEPEVE